MMVECASCGKKIDRGRPDETYAKLHNQYYYENDKRIGGKTVYLCNDCLKEIKIRNKRYYHRIGKFLE